ncbi:hypothetical protein JTB14_022840 [Gonioctena quinquepunctata]|nr:hypothetical protein JTB14_022840 [Gonioctena quinquepunctata]
MNESSTEMEDFIPVGEFEFHDLFEEESTNGLCLDYVYIPEVLLTTILSYIPPKMLLHLSLVCKKWCNIIKSEHIWMHIYNWHRSSKAKNLPWYVYYCYFTTDNFTNLVKNGNGQEGYKHWDILHNGDQFRIEDPPSGSDPLPVGVPDFNGYTSCFATSYSRCTKVQIIRLKNKRLLSYIMDKFMPHIYASEWVTGRLDCCWTYKLDITGCGGEHTKGDLLSIYTRSGDPAEIIAEFRQSEEVYVELWKSKEWKKVELLIEAYPCDVTTLLFKHAGQGYYVSKMAGGVLRFVFGSIEPLEDTGETKSRRLFNKGDEPELKGNTSCVYK